MFLELKTRLKTNNFGGRTTSKSRSKRRYKSKFGSTNKSIRFNLHVKGTLLFYQKYDFTVVIETRDRQRPNADGKKHVNLMIY